MKQQKQTEHLMRAIVKSVIKSVKKNESGRNGEGHHTVFQACNIPHVFNIACAGTCECNCMPFPFRPDTTKLDCIKHKSEKPILLLVQCGHSSKNFKFQEILGEFRKF